MCSRSTAIGPFRSARLFLLQYGWVHFFSKMILERKNRKTHVFLFEAQFIFYVLHNFFFLVSIISFVFFSNKKCASSRRKNSHRTEKEIFIATMYVALYIDYTALFSTIISNKSVILAFLAKKKERTNQTLKICVPNVMPPIFVLSF